MWFSSWYTLLIHWRSVFGQKGMSCHSLLPVFERNYEPCLASLGVFIWCILDIVDPHEILYRLPFRHRNRILDIIPHDQLVLFDHNLLPFILGFFFIYERISINDVTQQYHINGVCSRPLTFFGSPVILFFILDDLSCPRWSSSLEVDLPLSMAWSYQDYYILLKLFLSLHCLKP